MRENEPGNGPFGHPRGEPERPLAEAAIVLVIFYASAFLRFAPHTAPGSIASPVFHAELIAVNAIRVLLVLYVMAAGDGFPAFGLERLRKPDPLKGIIAALGAFATIIPPTLLFSFIGLTNPLMSGFMQGTHRALPLVPLFIASSLATGYAEELFFRSYLIRRLERAGLTPIWASIASCLLFGGAHGAQGIVGIVSTTFVGLWFAWRWHKARNIHEIAIGHGLYDAAVFAIALYA